MISTNINNIRNLIFKKYQNIISKVEERPLTYFFLLIFVLFAVIIAGNILRKPKTEAQKQPTIKKVAVYHIDRAPKLISQGQVEKSGVIQIVALVGGVVQSINVSEGNNVFKGQNLAALSSSYQGGNTTSAARQIAELQYNNVNDTYQKQKGLIAKQRDVANQNKDNFEKLRDIASKSIDDTKSLVDLNNSIIDSLTTNISTLNADPVTNAALILSSKQLKSQFASANLQLSNTLRNAQYQVDTGNPPSVLSQDQLDLATSQLDIQEKALDLSKEVSGLQLQIARINETSMFPASPFNARVQHVFIKVGQMVSPGMPLFTLEATNNQTTKVYISLPKELATRISLVEPSIVKEGSSSIEVIPSFVSSEPIQGNLYMVTLNLPNKNYTELADKSYVQVELPIGYPDTTTAAAYIPLDSIYQTQEEATVFVISEGKAKSKNVTLGQVLGDFVEVTSGLKSGDEIIMDRNVIEGDKVEPQS